ncbi:hypothetical protein SBBP2_3090004 [Burkholderiales bacterium]|nr:hypothetical protein SBBP2_3090004 [Burkholderiales bacterium]
MHLTLSPVGRLSAKRFLSDSNYQSSLKNDQFSPSVGLSWGWKSALPA